ncbi:MAG: hypothetical protein OEO19_16350 [Gammaproteobacteria bacterium]|nr:hypothetical protein [Gammaproteobacteria bacterium]MDH3448210.1 hypothetical protein [Gammaproteobacteria bacterium]
MASKQKYIKREQALVVAIRLSLDTNGFKYNKWGGKQTCKPGDWVVDNAGDVYTVDGDSFARTYRNVSPGLYRKISPVWAEQADCDGTITTKEGVTHYHAGDYIVFNEEEALDGYAVTAAKFEAIYKLVE